MQIANCKMKIGNLKLKIYNLQFSILIFAIFFLLIAAESFAGDIAFSISHPDKKVSPSAMAVYGEKIYVSYIREEGDVYLTVLSAEGKTLIAPVRVNDNAAPANGIHQSPGMALGPNGEVYLTWVSHKEGGEFAADIRFARSIDGGKTFLPSVAVNDNPKPSSRGFESIAVAKDGAIYVAWLDSREKLATAGNKQGQGKNGSSSAYFTRSLDGGKTFEKNIKLDDNACPCCRTTIAAGPAGRVYVSWRKVFEGDIRDMVVTASSDNGRTFDTPVAVSRDQWVFQGCPHRGPSMAVDGNGILYYTWYTEGNDGFPAVYFSTSTDNGKTFAARQALPVSNRVFPDHSRLSVSKDGTAYIVWEEKTPVLSKILFASYKAGNGFSKAEQLSQGIRRSYEPAVVVDNSGSVFAGWTHDEIRFAKIMIRVRK